MNQVKLVIIIKTLLDHIKSENKNGRGYFPLPIVNEIKSSSLFSFYSQTFHLSIFTYNGQASLKFSSLISFCIR